MITNENIQKFKSWGLVLTPVIKSKNPNEDKKPKTKKGKWHYDWTDQELLDSNRIGAFHKDSNIYDVDFDDKTFVAHQFEDTLPPTLTIGKKVNGRVIATHKIYKKPDNVRLKPYSFPSSAAKGDTVVELLASTQTIIAGVDRVIINNVEPVVYDPEEIKLHLKMIAAFSELYKHAKDLSQRNDFYFRLGGALARETAIPMALRLKYVVKLCQLTGDPEIRNRLSCIERQQEQLDAGSDDVFGIQELSKFLGTNLKAFDEIKREEEIKEVEDVATGLEILNGNEFTIKDFPKPEYILQPIVARQQIRQVFAPAGTGKTLMMLHEAAAIVSGYDFLHYKNKENKKHPVLYVEGEMDSASIQKRLDDIESSYEIQQRTLNKNFLFFATLAIQKDMYFHSLTKNIGRQNVEITAKKIEKITGQKPIIYLDNITALTIMQEKEGAEWVELMQWLSRLRNRGYHVTFLHHPTKTGQTASGSNIKERSIDIDMKLTTPDEKTILEEYEDNHTQMQIEFLKWREHMNTFYSKKRIAIINRTTGKWEVFPHLTKTQRLIWGALKEGKKAEDIINPEKEGMSKANVYKVIKILKAEGVIEDEAS
tara:strand:- start:188 stop:1972 length:1785 start_codon:yes stop_codon:yes gene_type:complete